MPETPPPPSKPTQKHPRVRYSRRASFKARRSGEPGDGAVRDISVGGVFLQSEEKLAVGTEVVIYLPLELRPKKRLCVLTGRVVRMASPKEGAGFGIQFDVDLTPETETFLRQFLALKLSQKTG